MFGGWDGTNSLDDLWYFDYGDRTGEDGYEVVGEGGEDENGGWVCETRHCGAESEGPGPRSNAQMCFDRKLCPLDFRLTN